MKKVALSIPDWLLRGTIYQINPRTFSPEGSIKSVTSELPFLADLGFKIIYLCPIFEEDDSTDRENWSKRQKASETNNPKNPYRMNNYFKIDVEYGSMDELQELVKIAHSLGLRVLLDLVYAHIGPNAEIIKRHPEFVMQDEKGNFVYTSWNFPRLDFNSQGLREYLWCNMVYFVSVFDVDGFRCDVANIPPTDFWIEGRRRIRTVKPDAVLINEGKDYDRMITAFDSSYTWSWHEKIHDIICGKVPAEELRIKDEELTLTAPFGAYLLRDMDNHDTVTDWSGRVEAVFGNDCMELIQVLNYTVRGIPMVYAGNELADSSYQSMFANRFYMGKYQTTDRNIKNTEAALRRQELFKQLNRLKQENDIIAYGSTQWLDNDSNQSVVSFARVYNDKKIIFIGNLSSKTVKCYVEALECNFEQILFEGRQKFFVSDTKITLPPYGYVVCEQKL